VLDVLAGRRESSAAAPSTQTGAHRDDHHQPAAGRRVSVLAAPREPAAVHAAPRIRRQPRRSDVALGDRGARHPARVGRQITDDVMDARIAWRSVGDADVASSGEVSFTPAPGGRGTEVRVSMTYDPPAGTLGRFFAKLLGQDPGQQLHQDLRRLKQLVETGEIVTTQGQPSGRRGFGDRALETLEPGGRSVSR